MKSFTLEQKAAINQAAKSDPDLAELINNAPDEVNFDQIIAAFSASTQYPGGANNDGLVNIKDFYLRIASYITGSQDPLVDPDFNDDQKTNKYINTSYASTLLSSSPTPSPTPSRSPSPSVSPTPSTTLAPKKPNIILIISDDQRYDSLEHMPYLSSRSGYWSIFTQAFTNVALCCPSRAAILNGLYSHHSGVENNDTADLFNELDNLTVRLDNAGYNTSLVGKYLNHWQDTKGLRTPLGWDKFMAYLTYDYYNYSVYDNGVVRDYGSSETDYATDVFGQRALNFVKTSKQPFFLHFSPLAPHSPTTPAPRYENTDVGQIVLPPTFNEADVSDKPAWVQALTLKDEGIVKNSYRKQYRTLLAVDEWIEKIFAAIQQRNIHQNTIIIYIGDNGMSNADHRIYGKVCVYDACNHIPLLIRYPKNSGRTINDLVTNVDIAPTIAELAGVSYPGLDGQSLVPRLKNTGTLNRLGLLIRWIGNDFLKQPSFWGIIENNYKYIELVTGEKELYDRINDPYELENQANNPAYAQIVQQMQIDLNTIRKESLFLHPIHKEASTPTSKIHTPTQLSSPD